MSNHYSTWVEFNKAENILVWLMEPFLSEVDLHILRATLWMEQNFPRHHFTDDFRCPLFGVWLLAPSKYLPHDHTIGPL